jgi:predicted ATPase/DNA-binding SARP family transcriptional activator
MTDRSFLTLYLLGPPRIELNSEPVHIGRTKAVALLAYLAVTGRPHRRDSLSTLLWSEYDQSRARADLRRTLSLLNRRLGERWIVTDRETAGLRQAQPESSENVLWLDVSQFRQNLTACDTHAHPTAEPSPECLPLLEEAVALYRDDFLSGFTLRNSLAFDEWQFFQTERLKDQLASALERLARWYSKREEYDRALAYARRRLKQDLLNEAAHRKLMELYALAGQQTAALRQYELCTETLAQELGVPASPETTVLYERIRAGEHIQREPEPEFQIPHNLPPQPTPFIGREEELAELDKLLADPNLRLITILGPGGVGKTRLGIAAAEKQLRATATEDGEGKPHFPNGVFFVPLAALSSADQIVPAVTKALGFSFYEGREPRQQLLDYLREKRALLVLDNFDHLLSGADSVAGVGLLADLLHTAPRVEILVTSRERLNLRQEQVYFIEGLAWPERDTPDASVYAAVKLFLQSARRAQSHFDVADDDLTHLVRICRLVEGMPLGIELAAAWVNMLSLADIADETQRGLDFLETDWRDVPARHRSIHAVFETSWQRLDKAERAAFCQLSVFRGGFTRQAAQDVTGASLRVLVALADKSLLRYDQAGDRYQIHELLRQYGAEVLKASPELETAVRGRHCAHFCAWLANRKAELGGARQQEALAEIEADISNVQAAWNWAAGQRKLAYIDQGMDSLCRFFELRNRNEEGEAAARIVATGLAEAEPETAEEQLLLAKALAWQGRFNRILGRVEVADQQIQQSVALLEGPALADHDTRAIQALAAMPQSNLIQAWGAVLAEDKPRFEQNLALYRELGDQIGVAEALFGLGWVAIRTGSNAEAQQHFEDSLALYRVMGNHLRAADVLIVLGWAARGLGLYDQARRLFQESTDLSRAQSNLQGMAQGLRELSYLDEFQGRFEAAARLSRESAALWREAGNRPGLVSALQASGTANVWSGRFEQAHAALEEAAAICTDLGNPDYLGNTTTLQAMVNVYAGKYQEACTQAQAALKLVGHSAGRASDPAAPYQILAWAALAQEQFAEALGWAEKSVTLYRKRKDSLGREWLAWSLARLSRAAYGLGNHVEARRHLFEALGITVEMGAFIPLMHLMPIIPVVLAAEDDPGLKERALELYALAASHPFIANARLFEDIAGKHIAAATETLPPDVIAAAQERGRALDWWETAEALLNELDW